MHNPLTRRQVLGGGAFLAAAWVSLQLFGHRSLEPPAAHSPFLGDGARRTLEAAFLVLLPSEAAAKRTAGLVDDFLATSDPLVGEQLRLALTALEHLGGFGLFSFLRFSRLDRSGQEAVLEQWERSRLGFKRQIYQGIRKTALFTYYADPVNWPEIGYEGPWVKT